MFYRIKPMCRTTNAREEICMDGNNVKKDDENGHENGHESHENGSPAVARLSLQCLGIVGSLLKISLPATEFDNLWMNIELHSRTIKSVHSSLMKLS